MVILRLMKNSQSKGWWNLYILIAANQLKMVERQGLHSYNASLRRVAVSWFSKSTLVVELIITRNVVCSTQLPMLLSSISWRSPAFRWSLNNFLFSISNFLHISSTVPTLKSACALPFSPHQALYDFAAKIIKQPRPG